MHDYILHGDLTENSTMIETTYMFQSKLNVRHTYFHTYVIRTSTLPLA